jgi:hypothetical protein
VATEPSKLANVVNAHAAELSLLRIMVMALHDQIPDKAAFLRTFDTTTGSTPFSRTVELRP